MSAKRGVALLGFGTVGRAVARRLVEGRERFQASFGVAPELRVVASRNIDGKDTSFLPPSVRRTDDLASAVAQEDVDVVVELLGGLEPARTLLLSAFRNRKSAVTANKKLLAAHGEELASAAARAGACFGIEASVAGGIPILRAVREGFAGDRIAALRGILNGTCNFVLTEMERTGRAYADVLADAQALGYAEADPASDVEGEDAAYKLALLSRLAFGSAVPVAAIRREGISGLLPCDFAYARLLGRTPRQLAVARRTTGAAKGAVHSVRTHLVAKDHLLAKIEGPFNAVEVSLEAGGDFVLTGRGAGGDPTATAVVSDIVEVVRSRAPIPPFGTATALPFAAAEESGDALPFALRFVVKDRPGILAEICGTLARHDINIDTVLQTPNEEKSALPFVVTLEPVASPRLDAALAELARLPFHVAAPVSFPMTP